MNYPYRYFAWLLTSLLTTLTLAGCASMDWNSPWENTEEHTQKKPAVPTLADLKPAPVTSKKDKTPTVTVNSVMDEYHALLAITDDPAMREKILRRLADLQMRRSETAMLEGDTNAQVPGEIMTDAITAYRSLLKAYPDQPGNDEILYQLSKAYSLQARQDESLRVLNRLVEAYPDSRHYSEAQFRRGEIYFSLSRYHLAEAAFAEVLKGDENGPYYQNALYMRGWSLFKNYRFDESLQNQIALLDRILANDTDYDTLSKNTRSLVDDVFRVMGFAFSYQDGADTLKTLFEQTGRRHYEALAYRRYAELLEKQERYTDAIEVYRTFIRQYPAHRQSPLLHHALIQTQHAAGFYSVLRQEKKRFVASYGKDSEYWRLNSQADREQTAALLKDYLNELGRYHHIAAQQLLSQENNDAEMKRQANQHYRQAADYYQQFADTFPDIPATANMLFLLGETLSLIGEFPQAIEAYQRAAYEFPDYENGNEAGYAVIDTYEKQLDQLAVESRSAHTALLKQKISSQQRFFEHYPNDPRALPALTDAAEQLFQIADYHKAEAVARKVTEQIKKREKKDSASRLLSLSAWLVVGHSEFELKDFHSAEQAYKEVLSELPENDDRREPITNKLAASIYKQGEQKLAEGDKAGAVQQFQRVARAAPGSDIEVTAQFDAATYQLQLEQWQPAIESLQAFRQRYPNHERAADIPAKLAYAYRQSKQWRKAAAELEIVAEQHPDPEVRRDSLMLAAELYDRDDDLQNAIATYRKYAHTYPEPLDVNFEAMHQMSEYYVRTQEPAKRRFWLRKIMDRFDANETEATPRMRQLAAMSASVFAEEAFDTFKSIKLKLPLRQSLARKQTALKKALDAYQKTADYGIDELASQATYRMGEIYAQLSRDIMDSERPDNLNQLELEQYELLLEEQAFPFEEKAIALHEVNAGRTRDGSYDEWIQDSFAALEKLYPARYAKNEQVPQISETFL